MMIKIECANGQYYNRVGGTCEDGFTGGPKNTCTGI
jgi:hypothetical protein